MSWNELIVVLKCGLFGHVNGLSEHACVKSLVWTFWKVHTNDFLEVSSASSSRHDSRHRVFAKSVWTPEWVRSDTYRELNSLTNPSGHRISSFGRATQKPNSIMFSKCFYSSLYLISHLITLIHAFNT